MTNKFLASLKPLIQSPFNTKETSQLLTQGINRIKFWSWGVSNSWNVVDKGLLLKVNARRHKSYVFIVLAWDDTYIVYLISNRANVVKTFKNVYFDELVETIDNQIENIPQNKF